MQSDEPDAFYSAPVGGVPRRSAAFVDTDDAAPDVVLAATHACASAWGPGVRLLGNVRAKDITRAIDATLADRDAAIAHAERAEAELSGFHSVMERQVTFISKIEAYLIHLAYSGEIDPKTENAIPWSEVARRHEARARTAETERDLLRAEVADLKLDVIAFCALHAGAYARTYGLPDGHLHPQHYDTLARCGARMDGFTRAAVAKETPNV